ncbi:hypothetical protein HID58_087122 [Brassica napus]|uniref:Uncharacterized protein n=1 Tax=Brassica napus TaxID=3708 RepID=A0ABQ7XSM3_BRANA|nr:hypothetical protein HID58_087122 [Brassica napus]
MERNMSESKDEEALVEYKKAFEVMSAKRAAPKRAAPAENDDEVQFIRSNKRQAATVPAPSSSMKKSKASGSTQKASPSSSNDPATVLANLKTRVFPSTPMLLPEEDSLAAIRSFQGDLLQVMSQLFCHGKMMDYQASIKVEMDTLASQLHEKKDNVLAKEKEINALRLKVRNQDEEGMMAASDNVSLREQLELVPRWWLVGS